MELYNMDLGVFHYLHTLVINESKSQEATKNKQAEYVYDEIEDAVT